MRPESGNFEIIFSYTKHLWHCGRHVAARERLTHLAEHMYHQPPAVDSERLHDHKVLMAKWVTESVDSPLHIKKLLIRFSTCSRLFPECSSNLANSTRTTSLLRTRRACWSAGRTLSRATSRLPKPGRSSAGPGNPGRWRTTPWSIITAISCSVERQPLAAREPPTSSTSAPRLELRRQQPRDGGRPALLWTPAVRRVKSAAGRNWLGWLRPTASQLCAASYPPWCSLTRDLCRYSHSDLWPI